jgi:hypothetical protein
MPEPDLTEHAGPVRVSVAAQLAPLWRHGRAGESGIDDLEAFAKGMTGYVAENLERFADPRGADVYVAVAVDRGSERAAHEYRSGHFVKEEDPGADPAGPLKRRARDLLSAMEETVGELYGLDRAEARCVMTDVSAFETGWWRTHD